MIGLRKKARPRKARKVGPAAAAGTEDRGDVGGAGAGAAAAGGIAAAAETAAAARRSERIATLQKAAADLQFSQEQVLGAGGHAVGRNVRYKRGNCSVTINYNKDVEGDHEGGLVAIIANFECEGGRGDGEGKRLLFDVLKFIKENTRVFRIELQAVPSRGAENQQPGDEEKLVAYYESLGFKSVEGDPRTMWGLLDTLITTMSGGAKRKTRRRKKKRKTRRRKKKRKTRRRKKKRKTRRRQKKRKRHTRKRKKLC